jgi:drug/metabolite transporter (DMT)-like permease
MSNSAIFKAAAIVAAIFGALLLIVPNDLAAMYGVEPMNTTGVYNSQLYGAFLLGLAAINWGISRVMAEDALRAVAFGNLVGSGLALVVALVRQFQTTASPMGWLNVAIFVVFAAAFAYALVAHMDSAHMHRPAH